MKSLFKRLASVVVLGALLATIIPASASAQTLPAGCVPGAMYSSTTGQPCATTPTTNGGVVDVVGTPTLKLNYNGVRKESSLVYTATVAVKGGTNGINIIGTAFVSQLVRTNNPSQSAGGGYVSTNVNSIGNITKSVDSNGRTIYHIPANQTATFEVTTTYNPQQLFAGRYYGQLFSVWSIGPNGDETNILPSSNGYIINKSNAVTIIGERSPYIDAINIVDENVGTFSIVGQRLARYQNELYVDGFKIATLPSNTIRSLILVNYKKLGITPGYHSIQINHPETGRSNIFGVTVPGGVTTPECYTFGKEDLTVGSIGDDVVALKKVLNRHGYLSYQYMNGNEYANVVYAAMIKFQNAFKITPVTGTLNAATRSVINSLCYLKPSITVTLPTAGSTFAAGQTVTVKYTTNNFPRPVKVAIQLNKGAVYPNGPFNPVGSQNSGYNDATGSYNFTLPITLAAGNDYSFLVSTDYPNTEISGENQGYSANFSVATTGTPPTPPTCPILTRDLTLGSDGTDVYALKQYLYSAGYLTATNAIGTNYNAIMYAAMIKFQQAAGISPVTGTVNAITRAYIAAPCGSNTSNSSLTAVKSASDPASQTYRTGTNGVQNVTLQAFDVKSAIGDSKIKTITLGTFGSAPSALYVFDGGTLIGSKVPSSSIGGAKATFSNLDVLVPKDSTKTLKIVADYPALLSTVTTVRSYVASIEYAKPNGTTATFTANELTGNFHTLASESASTTPVTPPTTPTCYQFTHDIAFGALDNDVLKLKQYLIAKGYLASSYAEGDSFNPIMYATMIKFQNAAGITPVTGLFDAASRAYINSHCN